MKLTEKSTEVFNCVKNAGGKISVAELVEQLGRNARSIGANITDLSNKELVVRSKEKIGDNDITYVILTDAGATYDPAAATDEQ